MKLERIHDLRTIPVYLWKTKGFLTPEAIIDNFDSFQNDPDNIFIGLFDNDTQIGLIWLQVSRIENSLYIILYSINKEYQTLDGFNISALARVARAIKEDMGLSKILWTTTRPKAFEKLGFKRSKRVLMEAE
jgi:hypothetical protein